MSNLPSGLTKEQTLAIQAYWKAHPEVFPAFQNSGAADAPTYAAMVAPVSGRYFWKNKLNKSEIFQNGFNWTLVDNLTVGKARIWDWIFASGGGMAGEVYLQPQKANVRAGLAECWKGTTAMDTQRENILGHCKKQSIWIINFLGLDGTWDAPAEGVSTSLEAFTNYNGTAPSGFLEFLWNYEA